MKSPFVVVGGGVVGLSLARELAGRGARVTLLERHAVGETGKGAASAASLGLLVPPNYRESPFGRLLRFACRQYGAFCREIEAETGIDPGYRVPGGLHLRRLPAREKTRERALRSYEKAGFEARWLDRETIDAKVRGVADAYSSALHLPGEALVHPPHLLAALRESCRRRGVEIETTVGDVRLELAGPVRVKKGSGAPLEGVTVVVAAGAWTTAVLGAEAAVSVPLEPVRGQALEVALDLGESPILHFDAGGRDRSYSVLPKGEGRAWVGSTVENVGFDVATSAAGVEELRGALGELFPGREATELVTAWSGMRPRAGRRGGPFLGPLPGRNDVWVACGHYKNGIVAGPLSARLVVRQLLEEPITRARDGFDPEDLRAFWPRPD